MSKENETLKLGESTVFNIADVSSSAIVTNEQVALYFQFDNDEPQLFTTADETVESPEVIIRIQNTNEGYIKFTDPTSGKTFKLFARPKL